jgi:hypothetical protein
MKRFLRRAVIFLLLLACMAVVLELVLARANRLSHGQYRIGEAVYQVLESADSPHPQVTTLFLGDSVALQFFHLNTETSPRFLNLPSTAAISLGGQYCVLQRAIDHAPRLQHVYLLLTPRSWANNLDQIFTHDYFCGYFHSPTLVWEVWSLEHNRQLTEAHIGRMLLPNIMAENSYLNRSQSASGVPMVAAAFDPTPRASRASRHFLAKMKDLCQQRHISLTVLPCPCTGNPAQLAELAPFYDAPIELYDPELFTPDGIHVQNPKLGPVRDHFIAKFHLLDAK